MASILQRLEPRKEGLEEGERMRWKGETRKVETRKGETRKVVPGKPWEPKSFSSR
jgi:hypothetical protein